MALFRGAGGVVWEIDVPDEGTLARERFDAQLESGALAPVDEPKKTPAKKAASAAEG